MAVRFFGQFLIDRGEADASQVREALDLMQTCNQTIGETVVAQGLLSAAQVALVRARQREVDAEFGTLALRMQLLSQEQLDRALAHQRATRLSLGEALVRLGHCAADRLGTLLDAFKTDQAQYDKVGVGGPDRSALHPLAEVVLEILPRFLMRVTQIPCRVGPLRPLERRSDFARFQVAVELAGRHRLRVGLAADPEFAEAVAMATAGLGPCELDPELIADGLGEFLNVLAGSAASVLAARGEPLTLGVPDYDAQFAGGWIADLAVGAGRGALVVDVS